MATFALLRKHLRKLIVAGAILSTLLAFAETGLLDAPLSHRVPLILMFGQVGEDTAHTSPSSKPLRQKPAQAIAMNALHPAGERS